MRVSVPGKDVVSGGGPYLFDGSLETLQVHQSGFIADIFQWQQINTPSVHRCIKSAGAYMSHPSLTVSFPALPYIPHIEWGITSDGYGGAMDFPGRHINSIPGDLNYDLVSLPVAMIPAVDGFQLIATTRNTNKTHGGTTRQGDLYYTVFKRVTT